MKRKTIMGVPAGCFRAVIAICLLGILIGSFRDYAISETLANKTEIGRLFATYYLIAPYLLYAAAGACLFAGTRKRGKATAWTILIVTIYYAVYKSESSFGSTVRGLVGYSAGESSALLYMLSWLFWVALYSLEAFALIRALDDSDPNKLIAVGAAILIASITAGNVNSWLKQFAGRPRYKYLLRQDDPASQYREWWQMIPFLSGSDNFKSWPSGHMTNFGILFTLPMLTDVMKKRSMKRNLAAFGIACVLTLVCAYNRIHMTNHFLSDVCFGTLITYLIYAGISTAFLKFSERPPSA